MRFGSVKACTPVAEDRMNHSTPSSEIEQWRVHYNTIRPHSSLGYRPPAPETLTPIEEFANHPIAA